jgi:AraC-like DNA-binding protein
LAAGERSIAAVASDCGYDFKRAFGQSPSRYRKAVQSFVS